MGALSSAPALVSGKANPVASATLSIGLDGGGPLTAHEGITMTNLPVSLAFEGIELSIIDHQGRAWLTAADLARALGYARSDLVGRIYDRHRDEFTPDMTETVNLTVSGENNNLRNEVRIFSPRGCHLVALFAKTARAKDFRRWVLDVLDGISFHEPPQVPTVTPAQMEQLSRKVWAISTGMRFREAVQWNCWKRLRESFGVSPISALPADRFDDALAILDRMEHQADAFKRVLHDAESRFCKDVLRLGGDLADIERRLEQRQ